MIAQAEGGLVTLTDPRSSVGRGIPYLAHKPGILQAWIIRCGRWWSRPRPA